MAWAVAVTEAEPAVQCHTVSEQYFCFVCVAYLEPWHRSKKLGLLAVMTVLTFDNIVLLIKQ